MKKFINRETILYLVYGVLTTAVNYVVYLVCTRLFSISYTASNVTAFVFAVAFAFVTNKLRVFRSRTTGWALLKEIGQFVSGRIVTMGLETFLLWLLAEKAGFNDLLVKAFASVLIIILNYIFSKFIIFGTGRSGT